MIERSWYDAMRVGETVPPALQPLLGRLGVWEQFLQDGHASSPGGVSVWGSPEPYENDFLFSPYGPYGRGWHLDRARLGSRCRCLAEDEVLPAARSFPGGWARWRKVASAGGLRADKKHPVLAHTSFQINRREASEAGQTGPNLRIFLLILVAFAVNLIK